ncbi:hypothetical protein ACV4QK_19320 [Alteromonas macleodii]
MKREINNLRAELLECRLNAEKGEVILNSIISLWDGNVEEFKISNDEILILLSVIKEILKR